MRTGQILVACQLHCASCKWLISQWPISLLSHKSWLITFLSLNMKFEQLDGSCFAEFLSPDKSASGSYYNFCCVSWRENVLTSYKVKPGTSFHLISSTQTSGHLSLMTVKHSLFNSSKLLNKKCTTDGWTFFIIWMLPFCWITKKKMREH